MRTRAKLKTAAKSGRARRGSSANKAELFIPAEQKSKARLPRLRNHYPPRRGPLPGQLGNLISFQNNPSYISKMYKRKNIPML